MTASGRIVPVVMDPGTRIVSVGAHLGARIVSARREPRPLPTKEIQP